MSTRRSSTRADSTTKRPASPNSTPNAALGIFVAIARQILFIDARKVALFYLAFVTVLSFIESRIELDSTYYLVQKHSVLNQYGVKMGWFWTLVIVGPFIWFSSKAHNRRDRDQPIVDVCRLGVGTACWYFSVQFFHKVLALTSMCDKGRTLTRAQCSEKEGVWTPGYDISGHCFLMIYSILIITEEAIAYRHYQQVTDAVHQMDGDREEHDRLTRCIQYFFVAMLFLHAFWFKQIIISVLYYHIFIEEILGAVAAVVCWFVTYRMLYPAGFLASPIRRTVGRK
ncbi:Acyl-coenzyme A diphosphatase FITM2 [Caenorhabditis elegans]|uniref:Acyl-coenzyme A diphosphatase FITM2 n=1 Tax=Caenorhabditis elegans TaxID=6239 RepID=FITM2_CAEEL|nr:Acyl-coenzyme A diphosphatase FITM2 [Caenorhabditis elegans]Q5CZ37.1 RecName: Full=Acyl-coenzyme A diphosphatase FITM2; AltName: Full=FIT family protein fitm-2; AltName: Full=Fat storage-inducing transmembrane homolog 2; AltName: Full=Fat storage-inducing transmembrane protein 2; AltName: Full=Fat-inducing protein 2 [Caenorhabditis elegans]CAI58649.1 Acyl-coenzyme A diphosphatase FITM2 [Caenorhabditis elegans]|eukprot:NP_001021865.1 FIT family protein fitm-2 [Caenorhabditis elegans]